ncbi:hypothetical protein LJY25_01600 [Hymenobacter sp. BT175]|uniref:hypothetical protein n=1 Tax=Hymenobacter translucens TaxID=2886507 RepID=UPI001D0F46ED|nr:hypothetical protein [Hymenobacter translucens]MCC2545126.1 hypothetical protein [Hymenobacter translucens]
MATDNETENTTGNNLIPKNEQFEKEKEYKKSQSNGKQSDDPSAHRNIGANGYTQRKDQKDQLENLHIGGDETTPQGGNQHYSAGEQAQGPGFETEGSYELDYKVRSREQEFGEKEQSGPAAPPQDDSLSK